MDKEKNGRKKKLKERRPTKPPKATHHGDPASWTCFKKEEKTRRPWRVNESQRGRNPQHWNGCMGWNTPKILNEMLHEVFLPLLCLKYSWNTPAQKSIACLKYFRNTPAPFNTPAYWNTPAICLSWKPTIKLRCFFLIVCKKSCRLLCWFISCRFVVPTHVNRELILNFRHCIGLYWTLGIVLALPL